MTTKNKRARAIRRQPREESRAWTHGALVDGSIDESRVRAALGGFPAAIDVDSLLAILPAAVGVYRVIEESLQEMPTVADELALSDELCEIVDELQRRLDALPPGIEGAIQKPCWDRHGKPFMEYRRMLNDNLRELTNLLTLANHTIGPLRDRRGRRPASNRDRLLREVARWLSSSGVTKELTAEYACKVLHALGVPAPADPREAAKIMGRREK